MGALLRGNVVFLHIPKTGGSWVRHVLRKQGLVKMEFPDTHPEMNRLHHFPRFYPLHFAKQSIKYRSTKLAREVRKSYKFCFVRHPHDWYESYWRYMKGRKWQIDEAPNGFLDSTWKPNTILQDYGGDGFRQFMEGVLANHPGYLSQMYGWYSPPGEIDFVGRTESLVDDLLEALETAGIDVDEEAVRNTEKVNTSPRQIDRPEWDEDLRDAVRRLEAPAFERFGYE